MSITTSIFLHWSQSLRQPQRRQISQGLKISSIYLQLKHAGHVLSFVNISYSVLMQCDSNQLWAAHQNKNNIKTKYNKINWNKLQKIITKRQSRLHIKNITNRDFLST